MRLKRFESVNFIYSLRSLLCFLESNLYFFQPVSFIFFASISFLVFPSELAKKKKDKNYNLLLHHFNISATILLSLKTTNNVFVVYA